MLKIGSECMKRKIILFGVFILVVGLLIGVKNYLVLFYEGNKELKNMFSHIEDLEITKNQFDQNVTFEKMRLYIPELFQEVKE